MLDRPTLRLRSFKAIRQQDVFKPLRPVVVPIEQKTEVPSRASPPSPDPVTARKLPYDPAGFWLQIPTTKQWLRVVVDNRVNLGKRIFRVEMWDKDQKERIAIFRRATEAKRR